MAKQFTREEVAKLNTRANTLIILHDKVYNVTEFLNEHPGGEEILIDHGGKDGSEDFNDVGHSSDAFELMKKYEVGALVESQRTNKPPKKGWTTAYNAQDAAKDSVHGSGSSVYLLLAAILVVLAAVLYYR